MTFDPTSKDDLKQLRDQAERDARYPHLARNDPSVIIPLLDALDTVINEWDDKDFSDLVTVCVERRIDQKGGEE